eukprot:g2318.t1
MVVKATCDAEKWKIPTGDAKDTCKYDQDGKSCKDEEAFFKGCRCGQMFWIAQQYGPSVPGGQMFALQGVCDHWFAQELISESCLSTCKKLAWQVESVAALAIVPGDAEAWVDFSAAKGNLAEACCNLKAKPKDIAKNQDGWVKRPGSSEAKAARFQEQENHLFNDNKIQLLRQKNSKENGKLIQMPIIPRSSGLIPEHFTLRKELKFLH